MAFTFESRGGKQFRKQEMLSQHNSNIMMTFIVPLVLTAIVCGSSYATHPAVNKITVAEAHSQRATEAFTLAETLLQKGMVNEALPLLSTALQEAPDMVEALTKIGLIHGEF